MAFDTGDLVELVAKFRDPKDEDALIDPSTVTFHVKKPDDSSSAYQYGGGVVVKEAVGIYTLPLFNTTEAGLWHYRVESTGTGQAAREGTFTIKESGI